MEGDQGDLFSLDLRCQVCSNLKLPWAQPRYFTSSYRIATLAGVLHRSKLGLCSHLPSTSMISNTSPTICFLRRESPLLLAPREGEALTSSSQGRKVLSTMMSYPNSCKLKDIHRLCIGLHLVSFVPHAQVSCGLSFERDCSLDLYPSVYTRMGCIGILSFTEESPGLSRAVYLSYCNWCHATCSLFLLYMLSATPAIARK